LEYNYFISQYSALGASFAFRYSQFSPQISSDIKFEGYNKDLFSEFTYEINTLNRPFLPTSGVDAKFATGLEFNREFFKEDISEPAATDSTTVTLSIKPKDPLFRVDFYVNGFKPLGIRTALLSNIQGGALALSSDYPNYYLDNFLIGGIQKFYNHQFTFAGYQEGQIVATSFASGLLGIQYKVWGELYLVGRANAGVYNYVSTDGFNSKPKFISGFSATAAYNIAALPFEFSWSYSPEINKIYSSIRIGFIF